MLTHHLTIAFRHLWKQKMYSAIKIGGLALGIAACILLILYLKHEMSYDTYYPRADRIYRVTVDYLDDDITGVDFPAPFARTLENDFPEVEQAGRYATPLFISDGSNYVRRAAQEQNTFETGFAFFDQELVDIFQLPMVYGNLSEALSKPFTILISKSKAEKYFPNENPIGKMLIINDDEAQPYTIGGVMEDIPRNSHLPFDFLLTLEGVEFWQGEQTYWGANNYDVYVLLKSETDPDLLAQKLSNITTKYMVPGWKERGLANAETYADSMRYNLQPITEIHLYSEGIRDRLSHGDIRLVWLFGAVVIMILVIACINFINLSTARSANRAREVGMRKVVGAFRNQLVNQFLIESTLFSILSFISGVLLTWFLLPYFNQLSGKSLTIPWIEIWFIPTLFIAALIIGILSGLYPSFYLSAFKPIHIIRGRLSIGSKNPLLRSILVVFQFTTSVILIIGTLVIYQQMQFILNKKIGYDKDQVMLIQGTHTLDESVRAFKDRLLQLSQVQHATLSDYLPIAGSRRNGNGFFKAGRTQDDAPVFGQIWRVDFDYVSTLGMQIKAGRNFSIAMPTDSQAVVINEAMAKQLQLKEPIGKRITNGGATWEVIGVLENFHFESIREEIYPLALVIGGGSPSNTLLKVSTGGIAQTIRSVEAVWKDFAPHQPLRYTFLDESYARMYEDVRRSGDLFSSFAILAIIISCLGLFGLTVYMAEQRTKEMGIRKVLGASITSLVQLLSKDFIRLVLISIVVATPIAWYIMHNWLESFAYRIDISWWVFILAGGITLVIALLTMSFHSIKTAHLNPIQALKTE